MPPNPNADDHAFDHLQRPDQKTKDHGKKDQQHNEHERGLGAKGDEKPGKHIGHYNAALQLLGPDGEPLGATEAGEEPLSGLVLPERFTIPRVPPVTDQGSSPRCVAHSNAYDQNQHDRAELGRFFNFDQAKFFNQIGGGPNGAYLSAGLNRRRDFGYPEQDATPSPGRHRILTYASIEKSAAAVKNALFTRRHGVLFILPWYHSWFHTLSGGKLPAPDYQVGHHAIWGRGFNNAKGIRLRNSWGTDYGMDGDCFLPYAYVSRAVVIYISTDR